MEKLRVLLLGDVVGQSGCRALFFSLKDLIKRYKADVVIVNGENASDGFGIMPEMAEKFFSSGVDVITSGNHIWQKREILDYLDIKENLLRPQNYNSEVAGHGFCVIERKGKKIGVLNLQGRKRMGIILDCPFKAAKNIVKKHRKSCDALIIDFHAESSMEKESLAFYLDGEISLLVGTHTHTQTMDEKILPGGTGYITDLGMTGPVESVIGANPAISIKRSLTQMPLKMEVSDNNAVYQGILAEIDLENGKTLSIERINQ